MLISKLIILENKLWMCGFMKDQFIYYYRVISSLFRSIKEYISSRSSIGVGVMIKDSNLGHKVRIEMFSTIFNSSLGDYSHVGRFASIKDSVLGVRTSVGDFSRIWASEIGDYSYIGPNSDVRKCKIGKFSSISWNVTIGPPEHKMDSLSTHPFVYTAKWKILRDSTLIHHDEYDKMCEIGHDVWIGTNVVVLRGVKIGTGAIIGAGTIVTHDVPPYSIVVGVPARVIRYRFSQEIIKRLLKSEWWEKDFEYINSLVEIFSRENRDSELLDILDDMI